MSLTKRKAIHACAFETAVMLQTATEGDKKKALSIVDNHQKANQEPPILKEMDFYEVIRDMLATD